MSFEITRESEPNADSFDEGSGVRWHDYVPGAALVGIMLLTFLAHLSEGGMTHWGVSAAALSDGRYENIFLHIFAHGSVVHLLMNSAALLEVSGLIVAGLGGFAAGWLRFLTVFGLAALSSLIFFLSFHPHGRVPMIGASGAIYGLIGLLLFMRLNEELEHVGLKLMPQAFAWFLRNNVAFLLLLMAGGLLAGFSGGVAWEAHLGGFLLGFSIGPWILPHFSSAVPG